MGNKKNVFAENAEFSVNVDYYNIVFPEQIGAADRPSPTDRK